MKTAVKHCVSSAYQIGTGGGVEGRRGLAPPPIRLPSRSVTVSVSFKVYATHTLTVRADSYGENYGYYAGEFGNLTPNTIDGRTINAFYFEYSGLATKIYISPRTNIKQIQVTRLDTQETYTTRQYNDYFYFYETFLKSSDKDKTIRLNIKLISS